MDRDTVRKVSEPAAFKKVLKDRASELAAAGDHHHGAAGSVREAAYKGHAINVLTTSTVTVDGEPLDVAITVDNDGSVHYHGLPTRAFSSVIALVKQAIDLFPSDFSGQPRNPPPVPDGHDHTGDDHDDHDDHDDPAHSGDH